MSLNALSVLSYSAKGGNGKTATALSLCLKLNQKIKIFHRADALVSSTHFVYSESAFTSVYTHCGVS